MFALFGFDEAEARATRELKQELHLFDLMLWESYCLEIFICMEPLLFFLCSSLRMLRLFLIVFFPFFKDKKMPSVASPFVSSLPLGVLCSLQFVPSVRRKRDYICIPFMEDRKTLRVIGLCLLSSSVYTNFGVA